MKINIDKRTLIKNIVISGLLSSMLFVFTYFAAFPMGKGGYLSIADIVLFYMIILYRKNNIIIIMIIAYSLSDFTKGFPQYIPITIITRIIMILFVWMITRNNENNYFKYLFTCFISQIILALGYLIWDYFVLSQGIALTTTYLLFNTIQMAVVVICAPIFTYFVIPSSFSRYFLDNWV